jgi:cytosine permease
VTGERRPAPRAADVPAAGVPWTRRVGAFLAIGTSPGALVLGAGIAARNDGAVPLVALLVGAAAMVAMLYGQGLLGVVPPTGVGGTLSDAAGAYLGPRTLPLLHALLGFAMVGWFGFNVGLGGAALAAVLQLPPVLGPLLLASPIVLVAARGRRGWNGLAVVTTVAALALVALVVARSLATATGAGDTPWLVPIGASPVRWLADVGALIGYVSVFSLRAPDFSHGLASRRELARCVAALVGSTVAVALAGVALARATGTVDVVAAVSGGSAAAIGNLLVAVAVVAATFTTLHSGSLALRAVAPIGPTAALAAIAVPGTLLAIARFDRQLVPWLELLAVLLPPLLVPMIVEAAHRRRGGRAVLVTPAAWLPGSVVGVVAAALGSPLAPVLGLVVAGLATAVTRSRRRGR